MLRVLAVCLGFVLPAAAAQPAITGDDLAEIRTVIHRQIEAFRRDDAREAFNLVSPAVQESFGTPEHFLDVVRVSYRAMYRPSTVSCLGHTVMGGDAVQPVRITDRSGAVWVAYYAMQRQKDGSWRTNGCHLVQPSKSIST